MKKGVELTWNHLFPIYTAHLLPEAFVVFLLVNKVVYKHVGMTSLFLLW